MTRGDALNIAGTNIVLNQQIKHDCDDQLVYSSSVVEKQNKRLTVVYWVKDSLAP